jgi:hypothetical protein
MDVCFQRVRVPATNFSEWAVLQEGGPFFGSNAELTFLASPHHLNSQTVFRRSRRGFALPLWQGGQPAAIDLR